MPLPVLTKAEFCRRYCANEFGNRAPTWETVDEFFKSGYSAGPVHLRNRIANGPTWYSVSPGEVPYFIDEMIHAGFDPCNIYVSSMAPHHRNLIQGEVVQTEQGLSLYCSTEPNVPMREALAKSPRSASGIVAVSLLRHYMCANSYSWLEHLLENFPDHVVEFSTFSVNWGTLPRFNSVYWEVRKY